MATYTVNAPPPPTYTSQPMYVAPVPQFIPAPEVNHIRDWLPWSIINVFIGFGLAGFIPLIFSIICRSNKRKNDAHGARTMSTLALIFNILITIGGIAGWIGFIIWLVWYVRFLNEITNS
jgi:hypothetical protein